jgi:hypothetical protein
LLAQLSFHCSSKLTRLLSVALIAQVTTGFKLIQPQLQLLAKFVQPEPGPVSG